MNVISVFQLNVSQSFLLALMNQKVNYFWLGIGWQNGIRAAIHVGRYFPLLSIIHVYQISGYFISIKRSHRRRHLLFHPFWLGIHVFYVSMVAIFSCKKLNEWLDSFIPECACICRPLYYFVVVISICEFKCHILSFSRLYFIISISIQILLLNDKWIR